MEELEALRAATKTEIAPELFEEQLALENQALTAAVERYRTVSANVTQARRIASRLAA